VAIAIGDIHGRLAYLKLLVEMLPQDEPLVFLGDYIDRGPNSAQVVAYLETLRRQREVVLLMGNHEAMMAAAIRDTKNIRLWLYNGGRATLKSYGQVPAEWEKMADRAAAVEGFLPFFESLKPYHEDEFAIYVHAGIDVDVPSMAQQDER